MYCYNKKCQCNKEYRTTNMIDEQAGSHFSKQQESPQCMGFKNTPTKNILKHCFQVEDFNLVKV